MRHLKKVCGAFERFIWSVVILIGAFAAHAVAVICLGLAVVVAALLLTDVISSLFQVNVAIGASSTVTIRMPLLSLSGVAALAYVVFAIKSAFQCKQADNSFLSRIDATL
jgi:hypothetical protein